LKGRLLETRGFLQNVQPDEIAGAQSHTYELTPPIVRGWFGGEDYIRHLVLPDFFFHISIAHAILRLPRSGDREARLPRQPHSAEWR
jgi:uncharacterized protein